MPTPVLESENLRLIVSDPAEVLAWVDSMSPDDRAEVSAEWLDRVRRTTVPDPWTCGFNMLHRETGTTVGSCAFKGPPDSSGVVEIAYGVKPEHQGKGYATEAAAGLVKYAFASGVHTVRAHTLREDNASTRVLTKCGFANIGEVVEPDDGLVWRWELSIAGHDEQGRPVELVDRP
jgi:RimJ/RimL family protein N-acetyltransferase